MDRIIQSFYRYLIGHLPYANLFSLHAKYKKKQILPFNSPLFGVDQEKTLNKGTRTRILKKRVIEAGSYKFHATESEFPRIEVLSYAIQRLFLEQPRFKVHKPTTTDFFP